MGLPMTPTEEMLDDLALFESWAPYLRELGDPEKMNFTVVANFLNEKAAPLAVLEMVKLMLTSKSEKVRGSMAKEVAYMGGFKPIERSQSINVNLMGEPERQAMLRSYLEDVGVEYIIESGQEEIVQQEVICIGASDLAEDVDRQEGSREESKAFAV